MRRITTAEGLPDGAVTDMREGAAEVVVVAAGMAVEEEADTVVATKAVIPIFISLYIYFKIKRYVF